MISLELVVDDGRALLVPQHRHGGAPAVARIGQRVELVEVGDAVDRVRHHALARRERPSVLRHQPVRHRQADHALQPLEAAEDERAVGPRAGERHVEVIAAGLGLEAALARRPRCAVRRDPVAEARVRAHETAAAARRVVPLVVPDAVDENAHCPAAPYGSVSNAPRANAQTMTPIPPTSRTPATTEATIL